jgi:hypothetical protein
LTTGAANLPDEHPNPIIRAAIQEALKARWVLKHNPAASAWKTMVCPAYSYGCEWVILYNPKDPRKHAGKLRRKVSECQEKGH